MQLRSIELSGKMLSEPMRARIVREGNHLRVTIRPTCVFTSPIGKHAGGDIVALTGEDAGRELWECAQRLQWALDDMTGREAREKAVTGYLELLQRFMPQEVGV